MPIEQQAIIRSNGDRVQFYHIAITPELYSDVLMNAMASQITSISIVRPTVCSGADKKHQSSVSSAFVRGIHRWPVDSPHKWPVTRKMFPFDDVIMCDNWWYMYATLSLAFEMVHVSILFYISFIGFINRDIYVKVLKNKCSCCQTKFTPTALTIHNDNATNME